jgi:hypothetical protein
MREPRAFIVAQSNITERLQALMAGTRAQGNLALKVLDNFEYDLKIWCPGSDDKIRSDNTVAFQVNPDGKR